MKAFVLTLLLANAASAAQAEDVPACYDAVVDARIVRQLPIKIGNCEDCIIMQWPWFLDLDVTHVVRGDAHKGAITVLALQHTWFNGRYRGPWQLRHNAAGGYNLVALADTGRSGLCPADTPPMKAYITPGDGRTLDSLYEKTKQDALKTPAN